MKPTNAATLMILASSLVACMPPGPVDSAVDVRTPDAEAAAADFEDSTTLRARVINWDSQMNSFRELDPEEEIESELLFCPKTYVDADCIGVHIDVGVDGDDSDNGRFVVTDLPTPTRDDGMYDDHPVYYLLTEDGAAKAVCRAHYAGHTEDGLGTLFTANCDYRSNLRLEPEQDPEYRK